MMLTTHRNPSGRIWWIFRCVFTLGICLQVSCQKSSTSSASVGGGSGTGTGGTTSAEEEVDFEVSGTIDPTDFVQAQDSVEIGGVNLTTAGKYAISAFYLSPLGKKVSVYQGTADGNSFSFISKVPKRYLTIDVTRQSDGYYLGAFLPPALRNKLAKLRLNRTSSIAAKMATIVADKAAAGDEAAFKALSTNSISVADTMVVAQSVARVITEQAAQNKGISVDLAALTAKLIEKSNDKVTALQSEGQSAAVVAEKISEKTYETVFSGDAEATSPGVLAYRTNHDLGTSAVAKRDVAYETIKALSGDSTKYVDAAFRIEAEAYRNANSLSEAATAEGSVTTTYSTKFSECYAGDSNCAPAGYTPPAPPSSSTGGSSGGGNTCPENGWCASTMTYYIGGASTPLDMTGSGNWNGQTYTTGSLKAVITIRSQPSNQTASNGAAIFSVDASASNGASLTYQWQKQEGGSGDFSNVGTNSATLNLSSLTNADDNNDVYRVVVSATGGATSVTSNSATLMVAAGAPGVPTAVSGTAGNAQVSLTWTEPSSDGGSTITDYIVQYSSNSGGSWTTFADGASTSPSATIIGLTNGNAYTFQVAAVNSAGTGNYSSSSSSVTPSAPTPVITITSQPADQTASNGGAIFSVDASASNGASLTYQWQKQEGGSGDFNDVGPNSATLNLSSLINADDNNDVYRVVVSATGGATSVISRQATLTVNPCAPNGWCTEEIKYYIGGAATDLNIDGNGTWNGQTYTNGSLKAVITITAQPSSQTASNGSATFSVTASVTNGAALSYQWQKQESGAVGYTNVSGANTETLSLSGLTNGGDNGDTYRVLVSASGDATPVTSDSATLTVTIPPSTPTATINTQPENNFSTSPEQVVSFSIGATGDNIGYQWQYYGSAYDNADYDSIWRDIGGATSANYAISQQAANTMGNMDFAYPQTLQLRCVVTPAGGQSVTSSVARFVYMPFQHQLNINWVSSSGTPANYGSALSPRTITLSAGGEFHSPETVTLELSDDFLYPDTGWYSGNDTIFKVQMASSNSSNDADWTTIHSMATRAGTTTGTTTYYSPPATTGTKYYRVIAESMWPYTTINGTASVAMPTPYRWSGAASDTLQVNWPAPAASVPAAPTSVSGTAGNAQLALNWSPPASNGGADITGYTVEYTYLASGVGVEVSGSGLPGVDGVYNIYGTRSGGEPAWQHASNSYFISNLGGSGVGWMLFSGIIAQHEAQPLASHPCGYPAGGEGTCDENTPITGSWSTGISGGSQTFTVSAASGSTSSSTVSTGSTLTSYILTGLTNGTAYTVRVAATNAAGTGIYSNSSVSLTPIAPTAGLFTFSSASDTSVNGCYEYAGYDNAGKPVYINKTNPLALVAWNGYDWYVHVGGDINGQFNYIGFGDSPAQSVLSWIAPVEWLEPVPTQTMGCGG